MNLVIVESPTKARTISRFLGKDYEIKFSMGHVMDLPKSRLGVDVDNGFAPQYELISDKKKIIADLKSSAKSAKQIILATDPDREGEAIAAHVAGLLQKTEDRKQKTDGRKTDKSDETEYRPLKRIVFHEITKEAIQEALKNPRSIDNHLVDAQTARRVLDRLVGYKLSPLLWRKVRRGLSAGRVQSVALRLIVEREREIERFEKEDYWTISTILGSPHPLKDSSKPNGNTRLVNKNTPVSTAALWSNHDYKETVKSSFRGEARPSSSTEFELIEINGEKIELQKSFQLYDGEYKVTKTTIEKEEDAKKIVGDLKTKQYIVSDVIQKEMRRTPQPPYTTSTLQQDASRRLGMPGRRTMSIAQKLYEEGYITYHRTDSVFVASSFQRVCRDYIKREYGEKYVPVKPRFYSTKQKLAQEAHEAIRPTKLDSISNIKYHPSTTLQTRISNIAGEQGWRLYELIWRRAVGSQMADAVIESTTVLVDTSSSYPFSVVSSRKQVDQSSVHQSDRPITDKQESENRKQRTDNRENAYRLKANGSVLVFDGFLKVNPLGLQDNRLPRFEVSEKLNPISIDQQFHETVPPPRYNDASIIKTLEEKGIGRPSTYATIISTIESRGYIERGNPSTGSGRGFAPSAVGIAVNDFLVKNFSEIDDIPFTAEMEDSLDAIAHGEKEWVPMMKNFYKPFEKKLGEVEGAERVKIAVEETSELCPECKQGNLVIRTGRFGKFLACPRFPECKFTKPLVEKTNFKCPKDGGDVIVKKTRRGRKFFGCSNYPKCNFAAWKMEDIKG